MLTTRSPPMCGVVEITLLAALFLSGTAWRGGRVDSTLDSTLKDMRLNSAEAGRLRNNCGKVVHNLLCLVGQKAGLTS